MEKIKQYKRTYFSAEVVKEAIGIFDQGLKAADEKSVPENRTLYVDLSDESWYHNNLEEFFCRLSKS